MQVKCTNISWDTSNDDDDNEPIDLPTELIVEVDEDDFNNDETYAVADALSDATGFCVNDGYNYEVIDS